MITISLLFIAHLRNLAHAITIITRLGDEKIGLNFGKGFKFKTKLQFILKGEFSVFLIFCFLHAFFHVF